MTAKQTYLEEQIKKSFKGYTLNGFQSLVNELLNQNEIDQQVKKNVFNIFFKKCATKLKKDLCLELIFGDILIHITDSSEGGWEITTYPKDVQKDEDEEFNPDDGLDGGFCDGSAFNAVTYFIETENY